MSLGGNGILISGVIEGHGLLRVIRRAGHSILILGWDGWGWLWVVVGDCG